MRTQCPDVFSEMLNLKLICQSGGETEDEGMEQRTRVKIRDSEGLGRIGWFPY